MSDDPENGARKIMERVLREELDRSDGYMDTPDGQSDAVESILDALSAEGFYVAHESMAPPWMLPVATIDGQTVYRVAGPDEEL